VEETARQYLGVRSRPIGWRDRGFVW